MSTISPGGATTLSTVLGATFGFVRSVPLMTGIASGPGLTAALAALGLAGILLAEPSLALAMKLAGSAYLLWLAWETAHRGAPPLSGHARPIGYFAGLWSVCHNPKGWAMTLGASATFAALASNPVRLGLLLGTVFGVFALFSLSLWCAAGLVLARLMRTDALWRALNVVFGLLPALSVVPIWLAPAGGR